MIASSNLAGAVSSISFVDCHVDCHLVIGCQVVATISPSFQHDIEIKIAGTILVLSKEPFQPLGPE